MKISRPTMISVLKENTKGLTHMNRKQTLYPQEISLPLMGEIIFCWS